MREHFKARYDSKYADLVINDLNSLLSKADDEIEFNRLVERADELCQAIGRWNKVLYASTIITSMVPIQDIVNALKKRGYFLHIIAGLEKGFTSAEVGILDYPSVLEKYSVDEVRSITQDYKTINAVAKINDLRSLYPFDFPEFKGLLNVGFENAEQIKTFGKAFGLEFKQPDFIKKVILIRSSIDAELGKELSNKTTSRARVIQILADSQVSNFL